MPDAVFLDLSESQRREYIDAETVFAAAAQARKAALEVRGSMIWREVAGRRYLVRTSARGAQRSLGPDSPSNQDIYARFMVRKTAVASRLKALQAELVTHQRLARALRVGRVPKVVTGILNALDQANIGQHFLVVGTHALFAYESAAGVRFQERAMATQDVDLLFDTRQRIAFGAAIEQTNASLLGLIRKVDPSFEMVPGARCTIRNAKGFEVDIVRREAKNKDPHPMRMTWHEDDIWPVQIGSDDAMLGARRFDQMVIATSGEMAMMHTIHPLDFARIKRKLARLPNRDPLKRGKDALQATAVSRLVDEVLVHLRDDARQGDAGAGAPTEGLAP